MKPQHFQNVLLKEHTFSHIIGQDETKQQTRSALLVDRHIIIVGPPGIGKTTLAKNLAASLPELEVFDCGFNCTEEQSCPVCDVKRPKKKNLLGTDRFVRVQGSPDLTAEDLLGDIDPLKALKFGPTSIEAFTPGKIFRSNNGVLFFDELNRCSEKLQNALLQVLEEGFATIGSYTVELPANFLFIGTMNPEETAATEKLSDVFLDRFDVVYMHYPETDDVEREIVTTKSEKLNVTFPEKLLVLMVRFVRDLRENKDVVKKPSVRATMGLFERAQANAVLRGAKEVTAEDIGRAVLSVLSHRIELKPSLKYVQSTQEFVKKQFLDFCDEHPDLEKGGDGL